MNCLNKIFLTILFINIVPTSSAGELMRGVIIPDGSKDESVVFDSVSSNYTVVYKTFDAYGESILYELIYEPATKIKPSIRSDYRVVGKKNIHSYSREESRDKKHAINNHVKPDNKQRGIYYRYNVKNKSKVQSIRKLIFFTHADINSESEESEKGWRLIYNNKYKGKDVRLIGWANQRGYEEANQKHNKFSFLSNDLPGYGEIRVIGRTPIYAPAGEGPQGDVGKVFEAVRKTNYVSIYTAMPLIRVSYDSPMETLLELKNHLGDLASRGHIELIHSNKLQGLLDASHEAYTRNQKKTSNELLSDAKRYLHDIEHNTDSKVTSRLFDILEFDMKYLEKLIFPKHKHMDKKHAGRHRDNQTRSTSTVYH